MRLLALFAPVFCLVLLSAACSKSTGGDGGGSGATDADAQGADAGLDGTGNDTTGTDATVNDTGAKDSVDNKDTADTDAVGTDATGTDATGADATGTDAVVDATGGDDGLVKPDSDLPDGSGNIDGTSNIDGAVDVQTADAPDVPPGGCTTDADCMGLNFAPCLVGYCDATSKMCKVKPAADGVTCMVGGPCGGPGVCSNGSCNAPSTCKPDVCSPQTLACGTKLVVDLSMLGASAFGGYGTCSSTKWAGPEVAILLTSDVTLTASLSMDTTGVNADIHLFDIAPTLDGKCNTVACDSDAYQWDTMSLGLPAGVPRIVILETSAADTGIVTLSLDCTAPTGCGDGTCDPTETCTTCTKDCGACSSCGNGTCDPTENCITCPGDCGVCVVGCTKTSTPTCGGCACEAAVCSGDTYCCKNSWDSTCVGECTDTGLVTCPPFNDVCGDGICGANEYTSSCPNDCASLYCGDGVCSVSQAEDCTSCSQDCGYCMLASLSSVGCGDGKCTGDENCSNCAADCGTCGDISCVCAVDSYCCASLFDSMCQSECNTCVAKGGGGSCPVSSCGDGICGGETCQTCAEDCGKCPAYCGDYTCDPGETKANCPTDCAFGCEGKCGSSSFESDGSWCSCYSDCGANGDCCSDYTSFCP